MLCGVCKKAEGKTRTRILLKLCGACREKRNAERRAAWNKWSQQYQKAAYKECVEKGICPSCWMRAKIVTRPAGKVYCEVCLELLAEIHRETRKRRKANGLCPQCGNKADRPGRLWCAACAEYQKPFRLR